MTRLLVSDKYPHHHDLSAVLESIRGEIHKGSHRMTHDGNPETRHLLGAVLECNDKVMELLNRAGKMIEDLGLTGMLRGKANLNAIVAFSGAEYLERVRSARGVVTLEAKAGQIRGLDIVSLLDQLAQSDLSSGGDWSGESSHTELENIAATLRLENSRLVNDNLAFRAGDLEVVGQGNLSLETELVDYRLSLDLDRPEIVTLLPPPFNSVGLVLPMRVTGRWDNPGIMIDMSALIQMQFQRAMGIKNHLASPSVDAQAKALGEALEAELSARLNQLAPGEATQ